MAAIFGSLKPTIAVIFLASWLRKQRPQAQREEQACGEDEELAQHRPGQEG